MNECEIIGNVYKKLSSLIIYRINSINSIHSINIYQAPRNSFLILPSLQFFTPIFIYILQAIIMRFNIAMLFAVAATTQIVTASPTPVKWNDKDMEAGYASKHKTHQYKPLIVFSSYKFGAVACGLGAFICSKAGQPVAQDVFIVGGLCCSTAAASVTASQADGFQAAAKKIGAVAVVGKDKTAAGGKYVGQCIAGVCKMVVNKAKGGRSIDEPLLSVRAVDSLDEDAVLVERSAELESESGEDDLE